MPGTPIKGGGTVTMKQNGNNNPASPANIASGGNPYVNNVLSGNVSQDNAFQSSGSGGSSGGNSSGGNSSPPPKQYYTLSEAALASLQELGIDPGSLNVPENRNLSPERQTEFDRQRQIDIGERLIDEQFAGLEGRTAGNEFAEMGFGNFRDQVRGFDAVKGTEADLGEGALRFNSEADLRDALYAAYDNNAVWDDGGETAWDQVQQSYIDFANPQLERDMGRQRDELTTALYERGLGQSGTAAKRFADLSTQYGEATQGLADQAAGMGQDRRSEVNNARQQMTDMLYGGSSPNQALQSAQQQIGSLQSNPAFDYAAPAFQNITAGLSAGAQGNNRYNQQQNFNQTYNSDPTASSGRVIG